MAKDSEEYWYEDDCCMNCGEINFHQSKTVGICIDCADQLFARSDNSNGEKVEGR